MICSQAIWRLPSQTGQEPAGQGEQLTGRPDTEAAGSPDSLRAGGDKESRSTGLEHPIRTRHRYQPGSSRVHGAGTSNPPPVPTRQQQGPRGWNIQPATGTNQAAAGSTGLEHPIRTRHRYQPGSSRVHGAGTSNPPPVPTRQRQGPANVGRYKGEVPLHIHLDQDAPTRPSASPDSHSAHLDGGDVYAAEVAQECGRALELKHEGEWRPVFGSDWTLKTTAAACRDLDCGSAVSLERREESSVRSVWWISSDCVQSGSALRDCAFSYSSQSILDLTCSDSVRLVNGTSLCSGRLELKSDQSNQSWSSVCEADFDQQDAEVVCRELGCGAPSVLQGALYGEGEAPMWTKEFQCGGNESALLDCRSSGSDRNTCSPGRAVGLTCSEPVRLVGGDSRCAGTLEVKHGGDWRPVVGSDSDWTLKIAAAACRDLDCGSAVSVKRREGSSDRSVWVISSDCVQSGSALRDCVISSDSFEFILDLVCSDLLLQPNISWSSSMDGVSEAQQQQHQEEFQVFRGSTFTISCSIQPQYPGGSFQLSFTSSTSAINYTQPAVNHSADFLFPNLTQPAVNHSADFLFPNLTQPAVNQYAHFLFPAAEPAHQGSYSCVYHVHVFSHNFSSESRQLSVSVVDPPDPPDPRPFIIRAVVLTLILLVANIASYFYFKTHRVYRVYRVQKPRRREDVELDYYNLGVPAAEGGPTEE
ncbi:neurotrypsin-like [Centropristis striata]|uniref:neurotrypsin-like n=1 Tax=Centropristis striata TaxID=184440 RepID=UPI0027DFACC1|nr:neurotrypsin-like [Centropristis striata]